MHGSIRDTGFETMLSISQPRPRLVSLFIWFSVLSCRLRKTRENIATGFISSGTINVICYERQVVFAVTVYRLVCFLYPRFLFTAMYFVFLFSSIRIFSYHINNRQAL